MSALAKVFVVFVFILSVAFFGTSATLFKIRLDWKQAYTDLKKSSDEEFAKLATRVGDLRKEVDSKDKNITQLEIAQDTLGKEVAQLNSDLKTEQNKVEIARTQADSVNQQNQTLTTSLQASMQEKQTLQSLLDTSRAELERAKEDAAGARRERDSILVDLNNTQIALHESKTTYQDLQSQYDTDRLLLARYEQLYGILGGRPAPPIDAKVSAVDNTEGLVVLSVGEQDQVQLGDEFTVYRGELFVGKVKVIKLFPNLSGARIEWTKDGQTIQSGDNASTRLAGVN